jgi:hypothetical protein
MSCPLLVPEHLRKLTKLSGFGARFGARCHRVGWMPSVLAVLAARATGIELTRQPTGLAR